MAANDYVCIIEDEPDIRETLREILETEGFNVRVAANGQEALNLLKQDGLRPGVILLDLMMPVMNGWEFIEAAKKDPTLSSIPILIMSAASLTNPIVETAEGFIRKPVEIEHLLKLLLKQLNKSRVGEVKEGA